MNILAIDTSGMTAGVAIVQDGKVTGEIFLDLGRNHSEILLPAVDYLLTASGLKLKAIDIFACTVGPGSFTGIRIGVSTLKGLSLAVERPIVGLSTLEVLAAGAMGSQRKICPMIDARKGQVYTGLYDDKGAESLTNVIPEQLAGVDEFLVMIGEDTLFVGTGAVKYGEVIRRKLRERSCFAVGRHQVRASVLGTLAGRKVLAGEVTDALKLVPLYLRRSEAEEKIVHQC